MIYLMKKKDKVPNIVRDRAIAKELLQMGLREILSNEKFVPNIKTQEGGKPYLANSELHFNISHSQQYVLCAISDEEVGIDIQFHKKADVDTVARRMMSASEWQEYQDTTVKAEVFYDLWAKKESFLKFTGTGLNTDLRLVDIDACVQEIAVDDNYSCMLCTKEHKIWTLVPVSVKL